jgi:membrane associated rhomboid family serine protease
MEKFKSSKFYQSINWPFKLILLLWAIHLFQVVTAIRLGWLGVFPGSISGLKGVLFSPLIHADWGHLLSNTPPLFMLTAIILYFYRSVAKSSFVMIYLLSGLAVWLFGRHVYHIGASGVIYGLVAFVFWNGIFRRNLKSIALALIVMFYYGSMIVGVLPGQEGISWESHLLGGVVGIFTSFWFRGSLETDEQPTEYSWEKNPKEQEESYFLERDIFKYTKEERHRHKDEEDDLGSWFSSRTW